MVSGGLVFASPSMLRFLNPENFVAGNLSECLPHWEVFLKDYPKAAEIFRYVSQGINVQEFFVQFNGAYRGHSYNADIPPRKSFSNSFSYRHVGWKSLQTAEYYMQTGKVMKMSHAASALADSTFSVEGDPSAAISVANPFRIKNDLRGFSLAFP